jgi:hypothetical protein
LRAYAGVVGSTAWFLADYVVMPDPSLLAVTTWVIAAWLADLWDQFPHLAITSPEKRCGKTTLLELLFLIVPRPRYTTNISPAALYRVIDKEKPTLLMDEAQSISRRGSEASEVLREILNAGIRRNARTTRCGGERWDEVQEFNVYGPKVFALIGQPDGVLADRCLAVLMKRKTASDPVRRFRSRAVEPRGKKLYQELERWANDNRKRVAAIYDTLEPFDIANDRMADLLMPLQAVLTVAVSDRVDGIDRIDGIPRGSGGPLLMLKQYAEDLDKRDRDQEMQSPGVQLLAACREIFYEALTYPFLSTDTLLRLLAERREVAVHGGRSL